MTMMLTMWNDGGHVDDSYGGDDGEMMVVMMVK